MSDRYGVCVPEQSRTELPARRIDYGELPADATFLEVASGQYAIAQEFMRIGPGMNVVASSLGMSVRHIRKALRGLHQKVGCTGPDQLFYALRAKQIVLVEVHDHRKKNWLTRVSPAVPAERNAGV